MTGSRRVLFMIALICLAGHAARGGVLVTEYDIVNGRKNMSDPAFGGAPSDETGVGAAVRALLTGDPASNNSSRAFLLRAAIEAAEHLPDSRGLYTDVSAERLYEILLTLDIMPDRSVLSEPEIESLRLTVKQVLNRYLQPGRFAWEDERWCLGATALRLVASEALYAFNFPGDVDSDAFRLHARRCFERNLSGAIDRFGAWTADSPGYVDEAMEYLIVTAKAFRNSGIQDFFSDPRLRRALVYELTLLPPQQCALVKGAFMTAPTGATIPGENHGDTAVMAAADIRLHFPGTASQLIWFWDACGRPSSPLGILFIDTTIQPEAPKFSSGIAGGGLTIMRNNAGTPDESVVYVNFGPARGTPDRNGNTHNDAGDFSFIWQGIPLVMHDGWGTDPCTNDILNRAPWRHSVVLHEGAGDTPILPAGLYRDAPVSQHITGKGVAPHDFYSDGISQFFSKDRVDYTVGPVRLTNRNIPAKSHFRHVLFLKPDALLIWDQIEAPYPLEWNVWFPGENAWPEGNVLHLHTRQNVDLQVYFPGDSSIDVAAEEYPPQVTWDWPLVLRAGYGAGSVTYLSLDLFNEARTDSVGMRKSICRNLLSGVENRGPAALLTNNILIVETVAGLGVPYEMLSYDGAENIDLSRFGAIVVGGPTSAENDRTLHTFWWKFRDYVEGGGEMILFDTPDASWLTDSIAGPAAIPAQLAIGDCPVTLDPQRRDIKLRDDPLWTTPNTIVADSLGSWLISSVPFAGGLSEAVHIRSLPVSWSDSWEVLASAPGTFPFASSGNERFGNPSRVRVKHPPSKDFFALFLPRRIGEQTYLFDVKRSEPGFISFANPTTTWEIKAGDTTWTDANLSVLIDSLGVRKYYAFDCLYIRIGTETIQATSPMSIYYSDISRECHIMTSDNNVISYSRAVLRLAAGEVRLSDPFGRLTNDFLERVNFLTTLRVVDEQGTPLEWARVYRDNRLVGATDADGTIPVRWTGDPPTVRVQWRGKSALTPLRPGGVETVVPVQ